MQKLRFKTNVRLKDIVGRELINNDSVAIIELIKNSKDAGSDKVDIRFSGASPATSKSKLVIQDWGRGMSLDDITNKWLNIAYSEKKNSKEKGKAYAGSKGIGRFSCDRLGKSLDLYTKTKNGDLIWLPIDWTKFEIDERDKEIGSIELEPHKISDSEFIKETGLKKFTSGTVLVIKELRNSWGKDKLGTLKKELERFVIDPQKAFSVYLFSDDFQSEKSLNGKVENKIFEKLDFRTTSIHSSISDDGKVIKTTLRHDGHDIFTIKEKNSYRHLRKVRASVYYLNQPAKAYFKKETGYHSVEFGSVFLFLNGFRVFPYGEEADDWLALDRRKQQGQRRFLGTREVVGLVEIFDDNDVFHPVSSREGLVNNEAHTELTASGAEVRSSLDSNLQYGYIHKILKKLEKFVVDGLDWDRITKSIPDEDDERILKEKDIEFINRNRQILESIDSIIQIRSPEKYIIDVDLNIKYLHELAKKESSGYRDLVKGLQEKFDGVPLSKMTPADKRNLSKFIARQAKELAAKEESNQKLQEKTEKLTQEKVETEKKLKVEEKRRLFAEAQTSIDYDHVVNVQHQVGIMAETLYGDIDLLLSSYNEDKKSITVDQCIEEFRNAIYMVDQIRQLSKFITRANFDLASDVVKEDLLQFIEEYINVICNLSIGRDVRIEFKNPQKLSWHMKFRPIEISMLVDNIINNAEKAGASNLTVLASEIKGTVTISFKDNGSGLPKNIKPDQLFEKGVTTTDGSGLGLYHARQIVSDLKGKISIENNSTKGAIVHLEFKK